MTTEVHDPATEYCVVTEDNRVVAGPFDDRSAAVSEAAGRTPDHNVLSGGAIARHQSDGATFVWATDDDDVDIVTDGGTTGETIVDPDGTTVGDLHGGGD